MLCLQPIMSGWQLRLGKILTPPERARGSCGTILVVEDDEVLLRLLRKRKASHLEPGSGPMLHRMRKQTGIRVPEVRECQ